MSHQDRGHAGDILVVDDNHRIVELLIGVLSSAGYAARGAHDGQEALEAILAHRPALVLLDLQMPRMSGTELIEALAQTGFADLPIIVITASPIEALRITCASNVAYMEKSFTLDALLGGIMGVMCGQHTQFDTERAGE